MSSDDKRLFHRRRKVRDAVVLANAGADRLNRGGFAEVGGESLLERLLGQLGRAGVERVWVVTDGSGDVQSHAPDGIAEVHHVSTDAGPAEALRTALDEMGEARPFLLCDGAVWVDDPDLIDELVTDIRPNVLGVELRMHHHLNGAEMKFQLEPVDVPWYSRRVVGLGKDLVPRWCHGESIGMQIIGGGTFDALRDELAVLSATERDELCYEDVFSRLMERGHEFYTHAVQPGTCAVLRDATDLEEVGRRIDAQVELRAAQ